MTAAEERAGSEAELDRLRRRLYRADATDADLREYLAEQASVVPPPAPAAPAPVGPAPVGPAPVGRGRRRVLGPIAVAVALAACAWTTAALLPRPAAAPAAAQTPAPVRVSGPTLTAVPIDGTATAAERFEGVGDGVLSIHLPTARAGTLRAGVLVYSSRTSTVSWTAMRPPSGDVSVVARARLTSHVDFATLHPFSYAGAAPTRITVEAPEGLRWTVLVAAANGTGDRLR